MKKIMPIRLILIPILMLVIKRHLYQNKSWNPIKTINCTTKSVRILLIQKG